MLIFLHCIGPWIHFPHPLYYWILCLFLLCHEYTIHPQCITEYYAYSYCTINKLSTPSVLLIAMLMLIAPLINSPHPLYYWILCLFSYTVLGHEYTFHTHCITEYYAYSYCAMNTLSTPSVLLNTMLILIAPLINSPHPVYYWLLCLCLLHH